MHKLENLLILCYLCYKIVLCEVVSHKRCSVDGSDHGMVNEQQYKDLNDDTIDGELRHLLFLSDIRILNSLPNLLL